MGLRVSSNQIHGLVYVDSTSKVYLTFGKIRSTVHSLFGRQDCEEYNMQYSEPLYMKN